ncbi:hypothetical protein [Actinopolyspora halophila]|uniref:hypothetical protein n=1 Tax=Actinopolyspora halophila TaxID=1850 RepID=UPI00037076F9|nr:hypothetical protein [Actinopolyspora halophila]
MRPHPLVVFIRLCGVTGFGVFLGLAIAGLVGIITGRAFTDGTAWLAGVPVLAALGTAVGATTAWLTRRWFFSSMPRRWLLFASSGLLVLPLATAVGQGEVVSAVTFPSTALGSITTTILWRRGCRRKVALAQASPHQRLDRR